MTATSPTAAPREVVLHDPRKLLSSGRIKTALGAFVVCLLGFVTGLTFVLVSRTFDRFDATVRDDLEWKAIQGARLIAQSAELGMAIADERMIREAFGDFRREPDVIAILADTSAGLRVRHGEALPDAEARFFATREGALGKDSRFLWSWVTARIEGGELGKVALVMSLQRLTESARLRQVILAISALGCVLALFVSLLFVSRYIAPVLRFTEQALTRLKELNETLERRVSDRTIELQTSLDTLRATQNDLASASRRAGMADVATAVLHNVGNVLNSVNVAGNLVADRVRQLPVNMVARLTDLLVANQQDLGPFFTTNPKGQKFVDFLAKLGTAMAQQQSGALAELQQIQKSIDHIKVIVARQQDYAKVVNGALEIVNLEDVLEDAIRLNASHGSEQIEFVREFASLPEVKVDRHKLFQIVMNLVSNARHAVLSRGQVRRVTLRTKLLASDTFRIDVEDTGCGIPVENLTRVFTHGFTTKKDGHGFGLHSASCAAIEMGGGLSVHSDGVDRGARFALDLPLQAAVSTVATIHGA